MHHAVRLVIGRHRATKGEAVRIARGAHRVDGLEARLKERRVRAVVRVDEVPNACAAYRALGVYSDAVAQIIAVDRVWIVWLRAWVSDAMRMRVSAYVSEMDGRNMPADGGAVRSRGKRSTQ